MYYSLHVLALLPFIIQIVAFDSCDCMDVLFEFVYCSLECYLLASSSLEGAAAYKDKKLG